MAASIDSISNYLSRLLPEIKVSPVPEVIFLSTIKALVVPAANSSLSQWCTIGLLILLTNLSPTLRKAAVKLFGYLSFVIATEIALINAYVLVSLYTNLYLYSLIFFLHKVCSWISPSTTLQPLTVVILNVLNSLVPVYTDSLVLYFLVKEKASHSDSKINLVFSMGTPVLLKFMRLANAVMYIHTSAEFILTSFVDANGDVNPETAIMDMARMWNVYILASLQLVDNLSVSSHHVRHIFVDIIACRYSLYVHWSHTIKIWKSIGSTRPSALPFLYTRVMLICWSFFSHYDSSTAQSDEHRGPDLVLQFELYPPDRPQRRAAGHLVIPSAQQYRDAHRLG